MNLHAQERILVFENIFTGKHMELKTGDEVHLRFNVQDTADAPLDVTIGDVTVFGTVERINDKSMILSTKNKWFDRASITVSIDAIDAFRKYSPFRPLTKAGSVVLSSAAGLLATLAISNSGDILSWQNAGLAIGASGAVFMSKELFSDKMKYYVVEGWRPHTSIVCSK